MPLRLRLVAQGAWRILAICDASGCTFLDILNLSPKESSKVAAVLSRFAAIGPRAIPTDRNHLVDPDARLFQLRIDECRILWIFDQGRAVICCHAYRKKTNKAPPSELRKGCIAAATYRQAKDARDIIETTDEE